jgi:16S rRNA G966 N2-methylase RsmD
MKISDAALEVLRRSNIDGLVLRLPNEQLDRKLYVEVNKVLENFGGKWNRSMKAHVFPKSPTEALSTVIDAGSFVSQKTEFQFFQTPDHVVTHMIRTACEYVSTVFSSTQGGERHELEVLEPSAGHGAIIRGVMRHINRDLSITAVELDKEKIPYLYGLRAPLTVVEADFLKIQTGWTVDQLRLMDPEDPMFDPGYVPPVVLDARFDMVLMNPPFTKQQDIDHVSHAFQFVRPGGVLVAIMSPAFTFRKTTKSEAFRELVDMQGHYEDLPDGTFKAEGTNVKTVMVVLTKSAATRWNGRKAASPDSKSVAP